MDAKTSHGKPVPNATGHFWYQRITALVLIPLSYWVLVLLDKALNAPYLVTEDWLTSPVNAAIIIVWTIAVCYHAGLGLQVVLEDYVSPPLRVWLIRIVYFLLSLLGIVALAAIVYILLQGNYGLSL